MVLGLEAPAMAAPAVTSFTPSTGPENCVIVLTGTGLLDVPKVDQDVVFLDPSGVAADNVVLDGAGAGAAFFSRVSSTEMWVEVPDGTVDLTPVPDGIGPNDELDIGKGYKIRVDGGGTGTASATTFTRVDGAGGCAPTVTSVTPNCGTTDTVVKITGTNLIGPGQSGATTRFAPYTNPVDGASHAVPDVDGPTSISVVVPSVSANALVDGLIRVTTFATTGGTVFSPTVFDISDNCAPTTGTPHARAITLSLSGKLKAKGKVTSKEDPAFTDCVSGVPVKIQRKTKSGWKNVGTTTTSDTGSYSKKVKNKAGKYRAIAKKVSLGDPVTDVCSKATSATRKH
jgi:hypothetical protein